MLIGTLVAWMALIVASGAFAAMAFPAVRDLSPVVPSMPVMTESHWKVVAGIPAQRNFRLVQAAGWGLGMCSIALAIGCRGRAGVAAVVQWAAHLLAVASLGILQVVVMNPLDRVGSRLHDALRRGDLEASQALDREFAAIHGLATPLMSFMLVSIALAAGTILWRGVRPSSGPQGNAS